MFETQSLIIMNLRSVDLFVKQVREQAGISGNKYI